MDVGTREAAFTMASPRGEADASVRSSSERLERGRTEHSENHSRGLNCAGRVAT